MLSGALISLPEEFNIDKLDRVKWERRERGQLVKSVIQFQGRPIRIDDFVAKQAIVLHETPKKQPIIEEDQEGNYKIGYMDTIEATWANIYVTQGLVVVDSLTNRKFVRNIINKGLGTVIAYNITLNTAKIARDHPDHWVRGFSNRPGRVDRGVLYGSGVERDSVFGPELARASSRAVGWITNFFGPPVKVLASPRGAVTVWAWPPVELFLKFIKVEILPYAISLP